jgi:hypothetical protein
MIRRRTAAVLSALLALGALASLWIAETYLVGDYATLFALVTFGIAYVGISLLDVNTRGDP